MHISQDFRFSVRGFSAKRMAYLLDLVSLGFLYVHFTGSCEESEGISIFALAVVLAVFVLSRFTPRSDPHRLLPLGFGFTIFLAHMFLVH
jgi:hypothetical protein